MRFGRTGLAAILLVTGSGRLAAQEIGEGARAPQIDLPTLTGGHVDLAQLRGHPVVVTFWGTWCPPCRAEFPQLDAAYTRYHSSGLEIVAVNQRDQEVRLRDIEDFVRQYAVEFPVAIDPRGHARRSYRLTALPTTVFIDTAGVIRQVNAGPIDEQELARGLASILLPP